MIVKDGSGSDAEAVWADDLTSEDNSGLFATDENTIGVEDHAAVDLTSEECWGLMEDEAIDGEADTKNMIWEKKNQINEWIKEWLTDWITKERKNKWMTLLTIR